MHALKKGQVQISLPAKAIIECSANILIEVSHDNLLLFQGFDFNCDPANVVYLSGLPVTSKKAQVAGLQMQLCEGI